MENATDFDKTFNRILSYLVNNKICREIKGAYINMLGYICRRSFGNICKQLFENKFYCFENFKAEFLRVRHGSKMYNKKVLPEYVAFSIIQAQKNTKLLNLVGLIAGKLS